MPKAKADPAVEGPVESPPSHREAKKEETRQAIARAAVSLFEAKGFEATTMDEIAHAARVSRPTVFNYFPRKEDILAVVGAMMEARLAKELDEVGAGDPVDALRAVLVTMAKAFSEYPKTSRAFHFLKMQEARQAAVTGDDGCGPRPLEPQAEQLMALVERGQREGLLRRDFSARELLHHLFIGLFASTMGPWFRGEHGTEPLTGIVARHFELYLGGLRPPA